MHSTKVNDAITWSQKELSSRKKILIVQSLQNTMMEARSKPAPNSYTAHHMLFYASLGWRISRHYPLMLPGQHVAACALLIATLEWMDRGWRGQDRSTLLQFSVPALLSRRRNQDHYHCYQSLLPCAAYLSRAA